MKRADFVRSYANRSKLSGEWADLGLIDVGGRVLVALPCECGDEACEGWAMVSGGSVLSHLELYAPEKLRDAYNEVTAQNQNSKHK